MTDHEDENRWSRRASELSWAWISGLLSDVKILCLIFALVAMAGIAIVLGTSDVHGFSGVFLQNIGTALFGAGLIAFPLTILGHSELTHAARRNLQQLQEASADKILEERLSRQHIETLRNDTFGKPIIEHFKFALSLESDTQSGDEDYPITLIYCREYLVKNRNATPTLIDMLHHTTGPPESALASRAAGFVYVHLDMDGDVLEWDAQKENSGWVRSANGRSERTWRACPVSIGHEPALGRVFTVRARGLTMEQGSTLRATIISETKVRASGGEPFVVYLPTIEVEVVVRYDPDIEIGLFPMHAVHAPKALLPGPQAPPRGNRMREKSWRWGQALFAGQGLILRWDRAATDHPAPAR